MKRRHRELAVWAEAMELVTEVYRLSALFPRNEAFGLTSQMRRAAISIPPNIAEGAARSSKRELMQFVSVALGSAAELDAQLQMRLDSVSEQLAAIRSKLRTQVRS